MNYSLSISVSNEYQIQPINLTSNKGHYQTSATRGIWFLSGDQSGFENGILGFS